MMKRLLLALLLASPLAAQMPAAKSSIPARFAHEVKTTFTDMKHHPQWAVYAVGTMVANSMDAWSTTKFRSVGIQEGGIPKYWIGVGPKTHKIVLSEFFVTMTNLVAVHKLTTMVVETCERDAADPNSPWHKVDALSHNPESCWWNVPAGASFSWMRTGWVVKHNLDAYNQAKEKL